MQIRDPIPRALFCVPLSPVVVKLKGAIRIEEDEVQVYLKNRQIGGGEFAAAAVLMRTKPLKHIRPRK